MKKYFIFIYWLSISLQIFSSWKCSSQKIELQTAQSKNIDFLFDQAKLLWEQRSDSNAVKKVNYILGLANEVEHNNSDLLYLYSRSLFFQGIFLENDKTKKDSLFLKGAKIGEYSVLNDSLFKSILNETKVDSDFKILSALSIAPKKLVPGMYWWATINSGT